MLPFLPTSLPDIPNVIPFTIAWALVSAIVVMLMGNRAALARMTALVLSIPPLAVSTYMAIAIIQGDAGSYMFRTTWSWIPALGISADFGLDGLGISMFWLTALLTTVSIVFSWDVTEKAGPFFGLILLVEVAVMGVFSALDLFLFYVFWEVTLVPMYFLISIWGGANRKYAAIKFFIYTFLASLVMLLGFMALYFVQDGSRTFGFEAITELAPALDPGFQKVVFLALFAGFATKFPIVPVHTWLPDAHVEAPTAGSVILAGVLLKMGAYGLIRVALPMAPVGAQWAVPLMFVLGAVSMIYAAVICLAQRDYKRLVAYSSIGSMGLTLLGIATLNHIGLVGAMIMMFAHGLISPWLFMLCGVMQHNIGTRDIDRMGGLATKMPQTAVLLAAGSLAGLGLPGMAAFVSEFQIFTGVWEAFGILIFIPLLYLALSAGYYLWALQRSMFGPFVEHEGVDYHHVYDLKWFEKTAIWVLVIGTVIFGVLPVILTDLFNAPAKAILVSLGVA